MFPLIVAAKAGGDGNNNATTAPHQRPMLPIASPDCIFLLLRFRVSWEVSEKLDIDGTWRLVERNYVARAAVFHVFAVLFLIIWVLKGNRVIFDLGSIGKTNGSVDVVGEIPSCPLHKQFIKTLIG